MKKLLNFCLTTPESSLKMICKEFTEAKEVIKSSDLKDKIKAKKILENLQERHL
jgi:hypothetical protein